jgi:3-methyladenine DNA glycosylase AlkD
LQPDDFQSHEPITEIHAFLRQREARIDPNSDSGHIDYHWPVPAQREFITSWIAKHRSELTFEGWINILDDLYHGESVEEKTIPGMLLARFPAYRRRLAVERLDLLDRWLGQLTGWKEIDSTCQSVFTADDLSANWEGWQAFLHRLNRDENINRRRASLALLVLPVRGTDERFFDLAVELLKPLHTERDKRISKAVSWLLRESVKRHSEGVRQFIDAHEATLPAFVIREVRTKLDTGKKR